MDNVDKVTLPQKEKTLKQIFRLDGYEVNRDDQKGLGNACLESVIKSVKRFIEYRIRLADSIEESEIDSHAKAYLHGVKSELVLIHEELSK